MAKKSKFNYEYKPSSAVSTGDELIHDGFATAVFGVALVVLAIFLTFIAPPTIALAFDLYHRWLESITWITGFGSIVLVFGTVFHGRARQKASAVLFVLAAITGCILVLYVDYFRPDLALPSIFLEIAQFEAFRMNIMVLAMILVSTTILGMILAGVNIKRNE
ncbi:MAG: hypothetical protein GYA24_03750 [Candidatus Lokiarchaeota archaeon]|nr:hypothetical protein [Candidatus Lokiarchaeota archaeon]